MSNSAEIDARAAEKDARRLAAMQSPQWQRISRNYNRFATLDGQPNPAGVPARTMSNSAEIEARAAEKEARRLAALQSPQRQQIAQKYNRFATLDGQSNTAGVPARTMNSAEIDARAAEKEARRLAAMQSPQWQRISQNYNKYARLDGQPNGRAGRGMNAVDPAAGTEEEVRRLSALQSPERQRIARNYHKYSSLNDSKYRQ